MDTQVWLAMIVLVGAFAYVAPAFVAYMRGTSNRASVAVVNVFLGWTLVGWVVALAMAVSGAGERGEYRRQRKAYLEEQRRQAWRAEQRHLWDQRPQLPPPPH